MAKKKKSEETIDETKIEEVKEEPKKEESTGSVKGY